MAEITTEAQLDELLNSPEALTDHVSGIARETMKETLGDVVREQVASAIAAPDKAKRPTLGGTHNPEAEGADLDGNFKTLGHFFKAVGSAGTIGGSVDQRLIKVLGEGQGDQGGFLVPEEFRTSLLSLALEQAVVRPRAFVMPMGSNKVTIPAIRDTSHASNVFGGVSAYWTPESGSLTASEPTFAQVALEAKKLTGYTTSSNELLADSAIALETLLSRLFGEAIAYFEDDAFIAGVGGGQPQGILSADALISVAKETGQAATSIVAENIDKMWSRLLTSSQNRAIWIAHPDTFPQLASLSRTVGTGGSAVWIQNMTGGPPTSIFGRPLIFSEKCETLGTVGDIYLVDLSYYLIGDRQQVTMAASPHVRFTNDEMVWRFVERLDGRPWVDSALTPRNGSNTVSPFVALATRS